jgi:hypothetical protein
VGVTGLGAFVVGAGLLGAAVSVFGESFAFGVVVLVVGVFVPDEVAAGVGVAGACRLLAVVAALVACWVGADVVESRLVEAEFLPIGGSESRAPLVIAPGVYESTPTVPITVPEIMKIGRFSFMAYRISLTTQINVHSSCGVSAKLTNPWGRLGKFKLNFGDRSLQRLDPTVTCVSRATNTSDSGRLGSERLLNQIGHGLRVDRR